MTQTFATWCGHAAYSLVFLSFLTRRMLQLRMLSMLASCAGISFAYFTSQGPLWIPISWNIAFMAVNAWQISILMWQRRSHSLTDEERFYWKNALRTFPPEEVKSFVHAASRTVFTPGESLIKQGTVLSRLYLIAQGQVRIEVQRKEIAHLAAGSFLGEMSFLSHEGARADVVAATHGELLIWTHEEIRDWVQVDPQRGQYLQAALGGQIIDFLMKRSVS
jgi:hypothetical protein